MSYINFLKIGITALVLFVVCSSLTAQETILDQRASIAFNNLSVEESLEKIEEELNVSTAYNKKEIGDETITFTFEKELLSEILEVILASENLSYKLVGNTVTIFKSKDQPSVSPKKQKQPKKVEKKQKFTLSGYIMDGASRETLIGANVYVPSLNLGVTSNEYGFYSLTLPEGKYELSFSYIGYNDKIENITLNKDADHSILLFAGNSIEEIVVTDDAVAIRHMETKMSTNKLSMDKLKSIPVLMGERDVLKMVQLLPGIQSGSEGSTGLYVRGGGPDQNLILLDGVPIYNVSHLFGFLSTLNGDAIKSAEIIKGGFPAHYGGRLSSIMDIRMKEGDMQEFHGDFTLGLIAGKINLEGPIVKDKTSFHFSARRTWIDAFTTPIQLIANAGKTFSERVGYNFYDLNGKINHKFSDRSRLYLSAYQGDDNFRYNGKDFDYNEDGKLNWGNRAMSLRWNYQLSPKLFSNTTIYNTAYYKTFHNEIKPKDKSKNIDLFDSSSDINDYGAKIDLNYFPSPDHHIKFGVSSIHHTFKPTVNTISLKFNDPTGVETKSPLEKLTSVELGAYVEDDFAIGKNLRINAGVHFSDFVVENSNYFTAQPRVSLSLLTSERSSVKFSYSQMRQFLHLLASPGLGLPNDLWVTSTDRVKPEAATQYAIGVTRSIGEKYELTIESYHKTMENLLEYKSGFGFFSTGADWEDKVIVGDGTSYGVELLVEKTAGKLTGWMGYTWSKTDRSFPDLNNGVAFPYKYDRRHDISLALTYKKSDRVDLGLIWVYGSGNTYTLGTKNYNAIGNGQDRYFASNFLSTLSPINHIEGRNNQRAPAYHRLDLAINFHKIKRRGTRTWSFGFYNAYSRQNPFQLQVAERRDTKELYLKQTSLLPIVPFFSYSFKF